MAVKIIDQGIGDYCLYFSWCALQKHVECSCNLSMIGSIIMLPAEIRPNGSLARRLLLTAFSARAD